MLKLWIQIRDAEPVALFTALGTLVPLITSGLVVFDAWSPTAEQLAWANGAAAVVAAAFGIQMSRSRVTPVATLPPPGPNDHPVTPG